MESTAISATVFGVVVLGIVLSMRYVYADRGVTRYDSFSEYLRKGWPIFTPFNCFLYLFTERRAAKAVMDMNDFKELDLLKDNWQTIAEEAKALFDQKAFDQITEEGSASYYDVGFRTFYKYGWSKFYLSWYGNYTHASAKRLCPKTVALLDQCPSVNGAMFSLLPPGSQLTRHLDPAATSMRYHLGLITPNSDDAFINVDGESLSWRDGEALMFDETYLHYAKNNTDQYRLILMCDVERPMAWPGKLFNKLIYKPMMKATLVPNTDEDKRGLANKIFSSVVPVLAKGKALKKTNPLKYKLAKYTINTVLLAVILGLLGGIIYLPLWALGLV